MVGCRRNAGVTWLATEKKDFVVSAVLVVVTSSWVNCVLAASPGTWQQPEARLGFI